VIICRKPFELNISIFLLPVLGLFIATGYFFEYVAAFLSIALHELGHILLARRLGLGLKGVRILPAGLTASFDETLCSRKYSIIISAAGPATNLLLAAMSLPALLILPGLKDRLTYFFLSNIYLACFNLIPAIPLDGGRILQELLSDRIGLITAGRYLRRLAVFLSAVFLLLGVYQLLISRINFTLFIIGFYMMLLLISSKTEAALMNMKQIIFRRSRLLKKGTYPARDLVALKSTHLGSILKDMDYDSFHFVYVLDDDLKTLGIFNENEIMESIIKYKADMCLGELIKICSGNGGKINI
jgi:stage IV sporulation protein FB